MGGESVRKDCPVLVRSATGGQKAETAVGGIVLRSENIKEYLVVTVH